MKLIIISLIMVACSFTQAVTMDDFIDALHQKESLGGTLRNKGDNGRSWGEFQIKEIFVRDYNRIERTRYEHKAVYNTRVARKMVKRVLAHYLEIYCKRKRISVNYNNLTYEHIQVMGGTYNRGFSRWNDWKGKRYSKAVRNLALTIEANRKRGIVSYWRR